MKKLIFILTPFLFISCTSLSVNSSGQEIKQVGQSLGKLETTIESIEYSNNMNKEKLKSIKTDAQQISNAVDRLEYLFAEYEKFISETISEKDKEIIMLKEAIGEQK